VRGPELPQRPLQRGELPVVTVGVRVAERGDGREQGGRHLLHLGGQVGREHRARRGDHLEQLVVEDLGELDGPLPHRGQRPLDGLDVGQGRSPHDGGAVHLRGGARVRDRERARKVGDAGGRGRHGGAGVGRACHGTRPPAGERSTTARHGVRPLLDDQ
jgi:hypothetical protein